MLPRLGSIRGDSAVLSASKLKRLDVDGRGWDLDLDDLENDGSYTASAHSGEEV